MEEDRRRELFQMFFNLADLSDQSITMVADCCGGVFLGLRVGRRGGEMLLCEKCVDFSF